jgi:peptide/nickel transport system substrate-binding protein
MMQIVLKKIGRSLLLTVVITLGVYSGVVSAQGKVLKVALGSMVASMDPNAKTSGPPATIVFYPVFDTLTFSNDKGEVVPSVATSWKNTSPTSWEFQLRGDVRFSNGEVLDAQAVKFTLDRVLNPENKQVVRARIATIKAVTVVGASTVRIETQNPDPILPKRLSSIFLLPPIYLRSVGEDGFAQKPIGSGPFKVAAFTPSSQVRLEAVSTSWRGRPNLDGVEIRAIPEASTRVASLRTGEAHIVESVPPDLAQRLSRERGLQVVAETLGQVNLILLNTADPALSKKEVRQALNLAVDKTAIVEGIMKGYAVPTGQLVASNGTGHSSDIKPYPYDPVKAKAMLDAAGVKDLTLTLHTTQGLQLNDREMTEAVAGYLNAVGVKTQIQVLETAAFVQNYHGGGMNPAFFIGWWYFPAMDGDFVYVWNQSGMKQSRFQNAKFDELYSASTKEMNPAKRLEIMQSMARMFHEEAPGIMLLHPRQTYGVRQEVQGFVPRPDRVIVFDRIRLQ